MAGSYTALLAGQSDLYAALGRIKAGDAALGAILAELEAGDDLARQTAARLRAVDQGLLRAVLRHAAGLDPIENAQAVRAYLASTTPAPLFRPELASVATMALLTAGERPDMPAFSDRSFDAWFAAQGVVYGLGAYGEKRSVYQTAQFADAASPERRTVHTGIDVFAPKLTPVYAPIAGRVKHLTYNADPLDYGHTLILQHDVGALRFYSLYGHLAGTLPQILSVGAQVEAGQHIADLGDWHENGGWAAHLHFQIMTDMLDQTGGNFYGVGHESLWGIWSMICLDPNLVLRLAPESFQVPD